MALLPFLAAGTAGAGAIGSLLMRRLQERAEREGARKATRFGLGELRRGREAQKEQERLSGLMEEESLAGRGVGESTIAESARARRAGRASRLAESFKGREALALQQLRQFKKSKRRSRISDIFGGIGSLGQIGLGVAGLDGAGGGEEPPAPPSGTGGIYRFRAGKG